MHEWFSHSRLGCFEKCPLQFRYRYLDRIPAPAQSIEAFLGKRVHEVLERLHRFVAAAQIPSLPAVLRRFAALWDEHYDPREVRIVREGMPAAHYRALGERCLTNFYRASYPFDAEETLGVEERVRFALDGDGRYPVQGVIDRLARRRDGGLEIHDYKTGRRIPPQRELDLDRQLALYEIGVRERFGEQVEIELVWHFLQQGEVRRSRRTPEMRARLREHTMGLIDRIEAERDFEARPSALCAWCEYRERCPAVPRATGPEPDTLGIPGVARAPGGAPAGAPGGAPARPPAAYAQLSLW